MYSALDIRKRGPSLVNAPPKPKGSVECYHTHVVNLKVLAAWYGRTILDKFDPFVMTTKEKLRECLEQKGRLSTALSIWCDRFYEDVRGELCSRDSCWLYDNLGKEMLDCLPSLVPWTSISRLDMIFSIVSHVDFSHPGSYHVLSSWMKDITEMVLDSSPECSSLEQFQTMIRTLSSHLRKIFAPYQVTKLLSYSLLAFPYAKLRRFLIDQGASIDAAMLLFRATVSDNLCLVAAGLGMYDYIREHLEPGHAHDSTFLWLGGNGADVGVLDIAAAAGDIEMMELVCAHGAVSRSYRFGEVQLLLFLAVARNQLDAVSWIWEHIDSHESMGLIWTCVRSVEMCARLIELGLDVTDSLYYYECCDTHIIKFLIERGAVLSGLDIRERGAEMPLYHPFVTYDSMSFMLRCGADPDEHDSRGTALYVYVCQEKGCFVELLLDGGADPNVHDRVNPELHPEEPQWEREREPIRSAVVRSNIPIAQVLLESGAVLDSDTSQPLLHDYCLKIGIEDVVEQHLPRVVLAWLVEAGIGLFKYDLHNRNALDALQCARRPAFGAALAAEMEVVLSRTRRSTSN